MSFHWEELFLAILVLFFMYACCNSNIVETNENCHFFLIIILSYDLSSYTVLWFEVSDDTKIYLLWCTSAVKWVNITILVLAVTCELAFEFDLLRPLRFWQRDFCSFSIFSVWNWLQQRGHLGSYVCRYVQRS